jgi:hypothetical protein
MRISYGLTGKRQEGIVMHLHESEYGRYKKEYWLLNKYFAK